MLLTDGEETCGGDPCGLARALKAAGKQLTIHVIGFRARGTPSLDGPFKSRCLADETGGQYLSAGTEAELEEALRKTLACPFITELDERPPTRKPPRNLNRRADLKRASEQARWPYTPGKC